MNHTTDHDASLPITPKASPAVMEALLRQALSPLELRLQDDSQLHAGHAGAREGGHYSLFIVSERFTGLNRVARHRLVYHSLGELMRKGIHALVVDARAPGER